MDRAVLKVDVLRVVRHQAVVAGPDVLDPERPVGGPEEPAGLVEDLVVERPALTDLRVRDVDVVDDLGHDFLRYPDNDLLGHRAGPLW